MKKQAYQAPAIKTMELSPITMLTDSDYVHSTMGGNKVGRGYGGVDEDGYLILINIKCTLREARHICERGVAGFLSQRGMGH